MPRQKLHPVNANNGAVLLGGQGDLQLFQAETARKTSQSPACGYRIWIIRYDHWVPRSCSQVPPHAIAREPAEGELMSARQATRYVKAFNREAIARHRKLWAVALPVAVRFEGEPHPGDVLSDHD